jgi:uncharacterized protein YdhG (YjbR/CyaY superfamily)
MEKKPVYTTIDEYIASCPEKVQESLKTIQATIRAAAPEATEKISYQMPTFFLKGNLVHFAAHTHHIGFYPAPSGIETFEQELGLYERSKGAVRFSYGKPLPLDLITRIVKFRVAENLAKDTAKKKRRKE